MGSHSNKLQIASTLRSTFLAALLGLHAPASSHAESLPEMVTRHEAEIKKLNEAIQALQKPVIPAETPECIKDFTSIGKQRLVTTVTIGVAQPGTNIILKLLKIGLEAQGEYIQFASNVPELHNRKLFRRNEYTFRNRNCNYTMAIEGIGFDGKDASSGKFTYVDILLNYQ